MHILPKVTSPCRTPTPFSLNTTVISLVYAEFSKSIDLLKAVPLVNELKYWKRAPKISVTVKMSIGHEM